MFVTLPCEGKKKILYSFKWCKPHVNIFIRSLFMLNNFMFNSYQFKKTKHRYTLKTKNLRNFTENFSVEIPSIPGGTVTSGKGNNA